MKLSFETKKYYQNNVKISKFHGVVFMIFGFLILSAVVYETFNLVSGFDSLFSTWNYGYDCEGNEILRSNMDTAISNLNSVKQGYETTKQDFFNSTNIDIEVERMNNWLDTYNELIPPYNKIISLYNNDISFYDNCYDTPISSYIDGEESYLNYENNLIDEEYSKLKPRAEAVGYVYDDYNSEFPF